MIAELFDGPRAGHEVELAELPHHLVVPLKLEGIWPDPGMGVAGVTTYRLVKVYELWGETYGVYVHGG